MAMDTYTKGQKGEALARIYLEELGWHCLAENYRCRWGEIDLILSKDHMIVFVEVKYRRSDKMGAAVESVSLSQQKRLLRSAAYYLSQNPFDGEVRLDVLGIQETSQHTVYRHIENAIHLDERTTYV